MTAGSVAIGFFLAREDWWSVVFLGFTTAISLLGIYFWGKSTFYYGMGVAYQEVERWFKALVDRRLE